MVICQNYQIYVWKLTSMQWYFMKLTFFPCKSKQKCWMIILIQTSKHARKADLTLFQPPNNNSRSCLNNWIINNWQNLYYYKINGSMTVNIMTLSIMMCSIMIKIKYDSQHKNIQHNCRSLPSWVSFILSVRNPNVKCCYDECRGNKWTFYKKSTG
jgi:hypothetical protein